MEEYQFFLLAIWRLLLYLDEESGIRPVSFIRRHFGAQIEGFLDNPRCLLRVGSRRSVIADIQPCDRPLSAQAV